MLSRSFATYGTLILSLSSAIAPFHTASAAYAPLHLNHPSRQSAPVENTPLIQAEPPFSLAAQSLHPNHRSKGGWLKELNLSREQLQKIKDIRVQYRAKLMQQWQAVQRAQQELKELMAGNASTEQIRQKFNQAQMLKREFAETRMESMLAIRNVLTPEQRQKLSKIMRQQGRGQQERMMEDGGGMF